MANSSLEASGLWLQGQSLLAMGQVEEGHAKLYEAARMSWDLASTVRGKWQFRDFEHAFNAIAAAKEAGKTLDASAWVNECDGQLKVAILRFDEGQWLADRLEELRFTDG